MVAYSDEVKVAQAGVPSELISAHGAVSEQVAEALAEGARAHMKADIGVGITGIAGPSGGTEEKPVGLVWLSVAGPGEAHITRSVNLPGARADTPVEGVPSEGALCGECKVKRSQKACESASPEARPIRTAP